MTICKFSMCTLSHLLPYGSQFHLDPSYLSVFYIPTLNQALISVRFGWWIKWFNIFHLKRMFAFEAKTVRLDPPTHSSHFEPELEAIGTCCLLFVRNVNQRKSNWLTCPLQFPETWARASCWGWIQGRSVSCCCHPIKSLKQSHHHLYRRARLVQLQLRVYINTNTIKTASQRASSLGTQVRTLSCTRWPANMRIRIVW